MGVRQGTCAKTIACAIGSKKLTHGGWSGNTKMVYAWGTISEVRTHEHRTLFIQLFDKLGAAARVHSPKSKSSSSYRTRTTSMRTTRGTGKKIHLGLVQRLWNAGKETLSAEDRRMILIAIIGERRFSSLNSKSDGTTSPTDVPDGYLDRYPLHNRKIPHTKLRTIFPKCGNEFKKLSKKKNILPKYFAPTSTPWDLGGFLLKSSRTPDKKTIAELRVGIRDRLLPKRTWNSRPLRKSLFVHETPEWHNLSSNLDAPLTLSLNP